MIVHRTEMRDTIGRLLSKLTHVPLQETPEAVEEDREETAAAEETDAEPAPEAQPQGDE